MWRQWLNLLAAGSLVLCALTLAAWVRSYWLGDTFYRTGADRYRSFVSEQGTLTTQTQRSSPGRTGTPSKPAGTWRHMSYEAGGPAPSALRTSFGDGSYQLLGVQFRRETVLARDGGRVDATWTAVVPYWLLALASGLWPAVWLPRSRRLRRQTRLQQRVCPTCGYDLRASAERCPECGSPAAPAGAPAPNAGPVRRATFAAALAAGLFCVVGLALFVAVAAGPPQPAMVARAAPAPREAVVASIPATRPATLPSNSAAAAAVQRLFDHVAAGRTADARGMLYDPADPAAGGVVRGWPALTSGACRLTVADANELDDCAVVVVSNVTDGSQSFFAAFAARDADGAWKVILPAGNYRPSQRDRYPWTEGQRSRMERLRKWYEERTGAP